VRKPLATPTPTVAVIPPLGHLPRDTKWGEIVTGRVAVQTTVHPLTPPVRPGDFWQTGRDTVHANPHAWIFQGWNDREILTVQEPFFKFPAIPSAMVIPGSPQPGQRPMAESVIVEVPTAGSWSALATIHPPQSANEKYLKLLPR
jgi:hypothetical protein